MAICSRDLGPSAGVPALHPKISHYGHVYHGAVRDPIYGTESHNEIKFVFLDFGDGNGPVDVTTDVTIITSLTRNDLIFDPPGPDAAFEMHLSCSDPFTGGWGQSAGPVEGIDTNWQIAYFSIARYRNDSFLKACGNVLNNFQIPNTAAASGEDSFGTQTVDSDQVTVTIEPGITIDRLQTNGKRLTVRLTNYTEGLKEIVDISVRWPDSNENLKQIRLDEPVVWSGDEIPPEVLIDSSSPGWTGGTLQIGEGIMRFDFDKKSAKTGYVIRVSFQDGTWLDISQ